ncbi:hypothetical protein ACFL0D_08130 [Thermoproteota archaeon]
MDSKKQFAKSILLGQRIFLNSQAMLNSISRNMKGNIIIKDIKVRNRLKDSLKDLGKCLTELEELTNIEMNDAMARLEICFQALSNGDISGLHDNLQNLYRDDYLVKIVSLSR